MDNLWLIWSIEHNAWWGKNETGYVQKKEDAGEYSYDLACEIVSRANRWTENKPSEAMIPLIKD